MAAQEVAPDDKDFEAVASLPAAAQVVEMPTADGEPPCVYVRGQRVTTWGVEDSDDHDVDGVAECQARKELEKRLKAGPPGRELRLFCRVVIETRVKEEPANG